MKLTSFTDYSLRVLIYLATEPGRRATIAGIAQAFQVSENHLVKVVHFLGKQGYVTTLRGKGGGLRLGRDATQIRLGEVVRLCEGMDMPAECFDESASRCVIGRVCGLHFVLRDAVDAFYATLDRHVLADVVRNPEALAPILFTPRPVELPKAPA